MKSLRIIIATLIVSVVLGISGPGIQAAEPAKETLKLTPIPSPEITGPQNNLITAISRVAE